MFVTRTGGSAGEVSATVATSDGTAVAGADYSPLSTTIRFGDGDTTRRAVPVEILGDAIAEDDKTVNLALSQPSCTTLGSPSSTVLTIVDDEPDPEFTIGGTVTGLEGTGLVLKNNFEEITPGNGPFEFTNTELEGDNYDVTIDAQPSEPGQICTVTNGSGTVAEADITDIAVDCVTPPPDAGLDPSFGDGGKVATPDLETALGLAVQPDGKIVASSDNALARYDADGTLDDTFGVGGIVATGIDADSCFPSDANDLVLQPDGSIVVVGLVSGTGGFIDKDVAMQRYDAAGNLDLGFGDQGTVTTDLSGSRDCAYGVTLQPDGKIVVAGEANGVDVAVLRYDAAGTPDPTFGTGGTGFVTTDIGGAVGSELDVATDLTLDGDGNIVVAARVSNDGDLDFFSVLRYTPARRARLDLRGRRHHRIRPGHRRSGRRRRRRQDRRRRQLRCRASTARWPPGASCPMAIETRPSAATASPRPTSPTDSVRTSPTTSPSSPTARSSWSAPLRTVNGGDLAMARLRS